MTLNDITMLLFTVCNGLRMFAYIPQIVRVVRDGSGCRAISYSTWGMFMVAHASAVAYALVNVHDTQMALLFLGNAVCCFAIVTIVVLKRHQAAKWPAC